MEEHAGVALGVTRLMGLRRRRIERRLKSLLFRSNRERLVHLLMELAEKYGQRSADGVTLGIKLSHQELASIIGSTRETVTVVLGELQNEGSLIIKRRQIILRDMDGMARSIEMTPPRIPVTGAGLPCRPPAGRAGNLTGVPRIRRTCVDLWAVSQIQSGHVAIKRSGTRHVVCRTGRRHL